MDQTDDSPAYHCGRSGRNCDKALDQTQSLSLNVQFHYFCVFELTLTSASFSDSLSMVKSNLSMHLKFQPRLSVAKSPIQPVHFHVERDRTPIKAWPLSLWFRAFGAYVHLCSLFRQISFLTKVRLE